MTDASIVVERHVVTLEGNEQDRPVDVFSLCIETGKTFNGLHCFSIEDIEIESSVSGSADAAIDGNFRDNDREVGIGQGDGERGSTEEHFIDIGSEDTASDLHDIVRFLRGGFGNDNAFASEMHFGISHDQIFIDLGGEVGIIELNGFAFIASEFCFRDTAFDGSAEEELFDCGTGGIGDERFGTSSNHHCNCESGKQDGCFFEHGFNPLYIISVFRT